PRSDRTRRTDRPSSSSRCTPASAGAATRSSRSEEHTSELQSLTNLVCRLLLEKKKNNKKRHHLNVRSETSISHIRLHLSVSSLSSPYLSCLSPSYLLLLFNILLLSCPLFFFF